MIARVRDERGGDVPTWRNGTEVLRWLWQQDDGRGECRPVQIGVIHIGVLCRIRGALPLGEQLGDGSGFRCARADVIEGELGVEPPAEDGERKQEDRYANGEMSFADIQIALVAVVIDMPIALVYTRRSADSTRTRPFRGVWMRIV